jgi:hypothetical protein
MVFFAIDLEVRSYQQDTGALKLCGSMKRVEKETGDLCKSGRGTSSDYSAPVDGRLQLITTVSFDQPRPVFPLPEFFLQTTSTHFQCQNSTALYSATESSR